MSDRLDRAAVEAADPGGMLGDVLAIPTQLGDALWRAESAGIEPADSPGGLVVCGMGGSAIGGDLAVAALGDRATRAISVVRSYGLESWAAPDSFVLCSSYSGETEETLACFDAAGAAGAHRATLTTGGSLAEAARAEGVPVIGVPAGMQPRAAVVYGLVGTLECAALCGAAPSLRAEIDGAKDLLEGLAGEWGPDAPEDALPKQIARKLQGRVPVVHGAAPTTAVARRWHTQVNENAKLAAFWSELPEANHNEICGWERGAARAPLAAVFLDDPDHHPRIERRIELTCRVASNAGVPAIRVAARGQTRLERVLSQVLLGDLVSVYLAVLEGVDPSPVEALVEFKRSLD